MKGLVIRIRENVNQWDNNPKEVMKNSEAQIFTGNRIDETYTIVNGSELYHSVPNH